MARQILIKPIVSEKAEKNSTKHNQYTFRVDKKANKLEIRKAVEQMYNIEVSDVRTAVIPGKVKSRNTRSGIVKGMKPAYKKAIVTVLGNEKIEIYGAADDDLLDGGTTDSAE